MPSMPSIMQKLLFEDVEEGILDDTTVHQALVVWSKALRFMVVCSMETLRELLLTSMLSSFNAKITIQIQIWGADGQSRGHIMKGFPLTSLRSLLHLIPEDFQQCLSSLGMLGRFNTITGMMCLAWHPDFCWSAVLAAEFEAKLCPRSTIISTGVSNKTIVTFLLEKAWFFHWKYFSFSGVKIHVRPA